MFKFSVVSARLFVLSFTYSEVFWPEDQNSFGSEAVSWRWLSMTIGGGVGGGDLLWGICALPGVPDPHPQLVAEDIYLSKIQRSVDWSEVFVFLFDPRTARDVTSDQILPLFWQFWSPWGWGAWRTDNHSKALTWSTENYVNTIIDIFDYRISIYIDIYYRYL